MPPDLPFWTRLLLRLAVEAAGVVAAAWLLDRLIRPAYWRRALWQSAFICLLLLTGSELSGFGRGLASFLFGRARAEEKPALWTSPVERRSLPLPSPSLSIASSPISTPLAGVKPEIVRPVWWPGLLWLAGGLVILGRVAAAQILFILLRRRRLHPACADLRGRVAAILQRLGFRGKISLLQSPGLTAPVAFGVLQPSVGLPVDFAAKFTRAEQDAMLAHELAHLAARDPLWYLLADVSSAALWWHPQAWWARRRLHRASELAADEAAAIFPEGPAALAGCLVTLGRQMTQLPGATWLGVEGGGFRSNLAERVQRLLCLADTARQPSYGGRAQAAKFGAIIAISTAAITLSGCLQNRGTEKQPTLQASLSQSWDSSPAATVWHSALPPDAPAPQPRPRPVSAGIAEKEPAWLEMRSFHVEPNSFVQALQRLFPQEDVRQANPMLRRYFASLGINLTNQGAFTLFNARSGDILARATRQDLDSVQRAIETLANLPHQPVPLPAKRPSGTAVLFTRTFHIDPDIFFPRLQEAFPEFLPPPDNTSEANGSRPDLSGTTNHSWYASLLRQSLSSLGIIDLPNTNGTFLFISDRSGLLVRAKLEDMEALRQVIELLNKVPPEVRLDVKFAIITQQSNNAAGFNLLLGTTTNAIGAPSVRTPGRQGPSTLATPSGIFPGPAPSATNPGPAAPPGPAVQPVGTGLLAGILNEEQFRMVFNAILQRERSDILSMGVSTASGGEARVGVTDLVDMPAGVALGSNAAGPGNLTNKYEEGPVMDVLPTVLADGISIQLVLKASYRQFLGFDKPPQAAPKSNAVSTLPMGVATNATVLPLPHYQVRQLSSLPMGAATNAAAPVPRFRGFSETTTITVFDGQTVVLGGPLQDSGSGQEQQQTNTVRENVIVFITPRIIDPAGNPVHTDEQMPLVQTPPPQGTNATK